LYQYGNVYGFNQGVNVPYQSNNQQVVKVNGDNGARMYQMQPNSSCLLLDESAPRIFLIQTDGACYKTISAYKIEPDVPEPTPDWNQLNERISRLEGIINESYSTGNESK